MSDASNLPSNGLSYKHAGVDIDAGNALVEAIKPAVRSTRRSGADAEIGGFGGLFDLKAAGFIDPVLVAANDGVGTKLKIAIDTGNHGTIGQDLVAMCVNDIIVQGAEPLFFLDYFATGKLDVEIGKAIVEGIAEGCRIAGCALIGGETAEMPGMYHGNDYDLAGFAVGAAERGTLLPRPDVRPGDAIVAAAVDGELQFGADAVIGRDQQRVRVARRLQIEEAAESAERRVRPGACRRFRQRADRLYQGIARRDRDAGLGVGV